MTNVRDYILSRTRCFCLRCEVTNRNQNTYLWHWLLNQEIIQWVLRIEISNPFTYCFNHLFSLGHKCRHSEYHGNEYYFCINISNFLCQFHSLLKYWRLSVCIEYFFSKCSYILIASLYVSLQFWYGSDFVWTSDIEGNF